MGGLGSCCLRPCLDNLLAAAAVLQKPTEAPPEDVLCHTDGSTASHLCPASRTLPTHSQLSLGPRTPSEAESLIHFPDRTPAPPGPASASLGPATHQGLSLLAASCCGHRHLILSGWPFLHPAARMSTPKHKPDCVSPFFIDFNDSPCPTE